MATAESASVRPKNPVETFLDGVSHAYASNLDRSAVRTALGEHSLLIVSRFGTNRGEAVSKRGCVSAVVGTAGLPGRCNLFRRPNVRLGKSYPLFCARNLTLMSLGKPLVHTPTLHPEHDLRDVDVMMAALFCLQPQHKS
jgi:hypothetical protein